MSTTTGDNTGGSLVKAAIRDGLFTRVVGQRILHFERLTSTMDRARREAEGNAADGTIIICNEQSSARGRMSREWVSPSGNLAFSVTLRPRLEALPFISVIASLAAARAIESETGLPVGVKWPNDVMIGDKKVCGLLVENTVQGDVVIYSIVGVGMNINLEVTEYPEIAAIATSLNAELGREPDASAIFKTLLHELDDLYAHIQQGSSPIDDWRRYLTTLGRHITARRSDRTIEGIAKDVDQWGRLLVELDNGELERLSDGEVTLASSATATTGR